MMIRRRQWQLCLFVLGVQAFAGNAAADRLRIVVGGPNFRPFPIALPRLVELGDSSAAGRQLAAELTSVLQVGVDLARSLEFLPAAGYLAPDNEPWTAPVFANWTNIGASGLIRGATRLIGDGTAHVVLRFFDVVAQREALVRSCQRPVGDVGACAHIFLDELVELLTGERGIFSSKLAYVQRKEGGHPTIFVSDFDGRNAKRITDSKHIALLPAWDPTGQFLLFTYFLGGDPHLARVQVTSGEIDWLSRRDGLNMGASVSPDGKRVAMVLSLNGNTEIYVMDWDGKSLSRLTDSWGQDVSPTWSPDGRRLAFVSERSGNANIYVMDADGSKLRRLTFRGTYNTEPDWSPRPDGGIAFSARDEFLKFDIFIVDPETGDITRLTQDEGDNEGPSHSPDGHHIAFTSTRGSGNTKQLYVMDVDGNNQRLVSHTTGVETPAWGPRLPVQAYYVGASEAPLQTSSVASP